MKKTIKKVIMYATICCLLTPAVTVVPNSPLLIVSEAHQGRTDSSGGHKDNKNKSGLGSYHYHCGGHPAHLHTNGVCPYSSNSSRETQKTEQANISRSTAPVEETTSTANINSSGNWKHNDTGWWYELSDGQYYKGQFASIDGQTYYFNNDGYMVIGWVQMGGCWFYFNTDGSMATGYKDIDGVTYYFDTDGAMQ